MPDRYYTDKTFKASKQIEKGDYENSRFVNCILPNSDLSGVSFIECEFENYDVSLSKLYDTSFKDVTFTKSKVVGLCFEDCNEFLFSIEFRECNLNLSSFYQMKPKNISFRDCNLKEVDFMEAELAETLFNVSSACTEFYTFRCPFIPNLRISSFEKSALFHNKSWETTTRC